MGSGSTRASSDLANRTSSASDTIDQALAGGAPANRLDEIAKASQETAKAIQEQNKQMETQNRLLESIGGNSGSSGANAIRQQAQQPRAE
jgi:hypothetical protein